VAARVASTLQGAAIGVAVWSIGALFQVLPGFTAGGSGLIVFALAGGFAYATRLRPVASASLGLAVVVLLTVAVTPLTEAIGSRWIRDDPRPGSTGAVVVLSSGVNADSTLDGEGADRLITGLELVRSIAGTPLVTTRVEWTRRGTVIATDEDQARFVRLFGGSTEWLMSATGKSTRDEALLVRELLRSRRIDSVAVVTSPMHTRRACAAFEHVGFSVACVAARARSGARRHPESPRERLITFGAWVYELAGMAKYARRGWI
jgi:uncharacterized SAM-binding protein YcdF (DUF218 family)